MSRVFRSKAGQGETFVVACGPRQAHFVCGAKLDIPWDVI
jgi:hypothetical protein